MSDAAARETLALLDGHSLAYRAFFALPEDLATSTGQLTNAVYGFSTMLVKLLTEYHPDRVAVMFDQGRPTQRLEVLPDYKGHREETPDALRSQLPLIDEVLDALAIPRVSRGDTEADDLIAAYARQAVGADMEVVVVTGDRDAFQVVDDHVRVLYTRRGVTDTVLMDAAAITEKYGVEPARYPMLAALRGDPSDNIPGVPGVGDKTAAKLLSDYGDLDTLLARVDEVSGKRGAALAEHAEAVRLGYRVACLDAELEVPVALDALRMGDPDLEAVRRVFATLEFRQLWERLDSQVLRPATAQAGASLDDVAVERAGPGDLAGWIAARRAEAEIAVVAQVAGHRPYRRLTAVGLAGDEAVAVAAELDELAEQDRAALGELLADPNRPLVVHGAKGLRHGAGAWGWSLAGVVLDVELAAYLCQPQERVYDLEALARHRLGVELAGDTEDAGQLALDVAADRQRVGLAAHALDQLVPTVRADLAEREQLALHDEVELPLTPVLARMEAAGIAVDLAVLEDLAGSLGSRVDALRAEIHSLAGREFNPDSPKQLQQVLFDELGLPKTKRIQTGYSTDAQALATIADTHPVVERLLEYREVAKLKTTYVDALPPLVNPDTGRIHAEFNQTAAVTGRLSSQHPNLQNIPVRTEEGRVIRRAFVPGEGFACLMVADYSQIELRVMAHLSGDEGLAAAFSSHEDIHATTAAMVWDLPVDQVDSTLRNRIKGMTYGLAYGLSAYGLSQQLGIPPDEAGELMDAYFARFPKVGEYLRGVVEQARHDGWTSTMRGRRRYLPDLRSDNRQRRDMAERMALNAPIQGSAADIIKLAMIAVDARMRREGLASQLLLQVHDELVCEVAPGEAAALRTVLTEEMSGVATLDVPVEVDTATGSSWYDAEKH